MRKDRAAVAPSAHGVREDLLQKTPFRSVAQEATIALLKTAAVVDRSLNRVLAPSGLSHEQYNVLRILRGAGPAGLPTLEIRRRMVNEGAAITRLLDKLERAGLVARERPAPNRRQVLCRLTPAGDALLERWHESVSLTDEDAVRSLSEREQRTLMRLLDRIRTDVRRRAQEAPAAPA